MNGRAFKPMLPKLTEHLTMTCQKNFLLILYPTSDAFRKRVNIFACWSKCALFEKASNLVVSARSILERSQLVHFGAGQRGEIGCADRIFTHEPKSSIFASIRLPVVTEVATSDRHSLASVSNDPQGAQSIACTRFQHHSLQFVITCNIFD